MSGTNSKGDETSNTEELPTTSSLENVLTNLKIIASLSPNDKLTAQDNILIIDTPYLAQGVYRWWNADSRSNTMSDIEKIINTCFELIDNIYQSEVSCTNTNGVDNNFYKNRTIPQTYFDTENSQQLQNFSVELTNAVKGLQNLKLTYASDISICSKIDVFIDKVNIRISKINKLLTIKTGSNK